jgi:hypothetical protein
MHPITLNSQMNCTSPATHASTVPRITIVIPVLDDWESLSLLVERIDHAAVEWPGEFHVLVVDDGSAQQPEALFRKLPLRSICSISMLTLRLNLGHQRAIAAGLASVQRQGASEMVVVMDGDGEDDPGDILRLVSTCFTTAKIAFAERTHRTEGWRFQVGYRLYQVLFRLATGKSMRVGNFSAVPRHLLDRLVVSPDLWNHYAAAVARARLPLALVPTRRGRRLHGRPRMSTVGLVVHGLSSLAVFADVVGARLLFATCAWATACGLIAGISAISGAVGSPSLALVTFTLAVLALHAAVLETFGMVILLGRRAMAPASPLHLADEHIVNHETIAGQPSNTVGHVRRAAAA